MVAGILPCAISLCDIPLVSNCEFFLRWQSSEITKENSNTVGVGGTTLLSSSTREWRNRVVMLLSPPGPWLLPRSHRFSEPQDKDIGVRLWEWMDHGLTIGCMNQFSSHAWPKDTQRGSSSHDWEAEITAGTTTVSEDFRRLAVVSKIPLSSMIPEL